MTAAAGYLLAALAVLVAWRAVVRLRAYRQVTREILAEAESWRVRAFDAEHKLQEARAEAERVRQAYARVIGRARKWRTNGYPAPKESPR